MAPKRTHQARGNSPKTGGEGILVGAEECAISNHLIGPTIEFARRALDRGRKLLLALRHGGTLLSAKYPHASSGIRAVPDAPAQTDRPCPARGLCLLQSARRTAALRLVGPEALARRPFS